MKVLFDHGTPAPLRQELKGHEVVLAREQGLDTLSNGDFLDAAEASGCQSPRVNEHAIDDLRPCETGLWPCGLETFIVLGRR